MSTTEQNAVVKEATLKAAEKGDTMIVQIPVRVVSTGMNKKGEAWAMVQRFPIRFENGKAQEAFFVRTSDEKEGRILEVKTVKNGGFRSAKDRLDDEQRARLIKNDPEVAKALGLI